MWLLTWSYEKGKILCNTLLISNFNHCPSGASGALYCFSKATLQIMSAFPSSLKLVSTPLSSDLDASWEDLKESGRSCPKGALRIFQCDFNMPFEVLLTRTDERKLHTKNLQKWLLLILKRLPEENPSFM